MTPTLAYAFDLGVGGSIGAGDGFSFFAPGRPAQMQSYAGDNQLGLPSSTLPIAPAVQIVNTHHNSPVGGAIVTCQVTGGGGSLADAAANQIVVALAAGMREPSLPVLADTAPDGQASAKLVGQGRVGQPDLVRRDRRPAKAAARAGLSLQQPQQGLRSSVSIIRPGIPCGTRHAYSVTRGVST